MHIYKHMRYRCLPGRTYKYTSTVSACTYISWLGPHLARLAYKRMNRSGERPCHWPAGCLAYHAATCHTMPCHTYVNA